jgi:hypothetical protein
MAALDELRRHAQALKDVAGVSAEIIEAGMQLYVVLKQVPLPKGAYRVDATDVLFIADRQYPLSSMDMFWTELEVLRPDGTVPQNANVIEIHADRQWRRFSWHRHGIWNPNGTGLLDHYEFMESRLEMDLPR